MEHTLVIVESPTKARTIRQFLPSNFEVLASMGHVRDLPKGAGEIPAAMKKEKWSRIGVNTTEDFEPLYVVPKDKKKVVEFFPGKPNFSDEAINNHNKPIMIDFYATW